MKGERQPTLNNRLGNVRWISQFRLLITLLDAATIAGIGGATDQDEDGETTAGAEPGFDVTAAADGRVTAQRTLAPSESTGRSETGLWELEPVGLWHQS